MGKNNSNRSKKRSRAGNVIGKAEVSDKDYRALQEAADKATAQLAAVKKTTQKSGEWETKERPSKGRRVCGAFNYFGCVKGTEC